MIPACWAKWHSLQILIADFGASVKIVKGVGFYSLLFVLVYILAEVFSFAAYSLVKSKLFVFSDMQSKRLEIIGSESALSANKAGIIDHGYFGGRDYSTFIHPYLGYLHRPMKLLERSKHGSWDHDFPIKTKDSNRLNIGIFGGSFAQGILSSSTRAFTNKLYSYKLFTGKKIHVYPMATGGYKQPQQLFLLIYLLTFGAHFDIIINLDGFNEIVLPPAENIPKKVFPFYPRNWYALSQGLEMESLALLGQIVHLEEKRQEIGQIIFTTPLRYSITANVLWYFYDDNLSKKKTAYEMTHQKLQISDKEKLPYHVTGPTFHYNDESEMYRDLASFWSRCSIQMHQICKGNGIAYYHFLQPNQYVPDSKPMQEDEKKLAYNPQHPYKSSVELGYPYLIKEGKKLTRNGIQFFDLTMLFRNESEPLYKDSCCHLNKRGYSMISAVIGDFVGQHYSNSYSTEGIFDGTIFSDEDG